jgi:hypothetical protein
LRFAIVLGFFDVVSERALGGENGSETGGDMTGILVQGDVDVDGRNKVWRHVA